ncbi:peptide-methionine (R)-S-oxide reductase [Streptomyces galbus]|uniref:peptide-methionine (R)-S-oxide reductase n=1 Tax=Streptomyces galbus TaxID=33898 RepID=UPI0035E3DAC6
MHSSVSPSARLPAGTSDAFAGKPVFTGGTRAPRPGGVYSCRVRGGELLTYENKFEHPCGWPSFCAPKGTGAVEPGTAPTAMVRQGSTAPAAVPASGTSSRARTVRLPAHLHRRIDSISLRLEPETHWRREVFPDASESGERLPGISVRRMDSGSPQ